MRRDIFKDARVRAAFVELFDFEWANHNLYFGVYKRSGSFYDGSGAVCARPPGGCARTGTARPLPRCRAASGDGWLTGSRRSPTARGATAKASSARSHLLDAAGWQVEKGTLTSRATGKPFAAELLVGTKDQERLALAYQRMLKRAGITLDIRPVDSCAVREPQADL